MKDTNKHKTEKTAQNTKCGVITCIHRVMGHCSLDACELQEKALLQES